MRREPRAHRSSPVISGWEKFHAIALGVGVPVAIGIISGSWNWAVRESENRVRYVELATQLLRSPPTPETAALREWAIELLAEESPVTLKEDAKQQLRRHPLPTQLAGNAVAQSTAAGDLSVGPAASSPQRPR